MNNGIIYSNQIGFSTIQRFINLSSQATKIAGINYSVSPQNLDYTNLSNFDIFANHINQKVFTTITNTPSLYKELKTFPTSTSFPGGTAYINCVIMSDGRIFFCPFLNNTGLILNTDRGLFSVPSGTYGTASNSNGNYSSGVLLFNGEILLIPRNTVCRVYNPKTNSVRTIGSAPVVTSAYAGGVLMKNGKVYCTPFGSTTALIIDPINNSTYVPSGTFSANYSLGAVLLTDGRVLVLGNGAGAGGRIYNPTNDTLVNANITHAGQTGCLLPDGRVYIAPTSGTTGYIYNPYTDSSVSAGTFPSSTTWTASNLTVDGGVFIQANTAGASPRIYYPATDSLVAIAGTTTVGLEFTNAIYIYDGRLLLAPRAGTAVKFYGYSGAPKFDDSVILSAHYNKRG